MFLWGHLSNDDEQRETGLLSGEAGVDAFIDTEILKYATGRERPFVGDGRGLFWRPPCLGTLWADLFLSRC